MTPELILTYSKSYKNIFWIFNENKKLNSKIDSLFKILAEITPKYKDCENSVVVVILSSFVLSIEYNFFKMIIKKILPLTYAYALKFFSTYSIFTHF